MSPPYDKEADARDPMLTSGDAAKYLGIHPHTLRRYVDARLLIPFRNPLTGHRTYRRSALDALRKRAERDGPPLLRPTPPGGHST